MILVTFKDPADDPGSSGCSCSHQKKSPNDAPTYSTQKARKLDVKKCVAIYNPYGGGGTAKKTWELAKQVLVARGIELEEIATTHPRHATEIVRDHAFKDVDVVIIVGGDGTLHESVRGYYSSLMIYGRLTTALTFPVLNQVNGMIERPESMGTRPLGVIPSGTGNNFFRDLRCPNFDPVIAARWIADGWIVDVDSVKVVMYLRFSLFCMASNNIFRSNWCVMV